MQSTLLFLSGPDLIVVAIVIIFLFGARKLPEFAKGLGQSVKEFKDASEGSKNKNDQNKA